MYFLLALYSQRTELHVCVLPLDLPSMLSNRYIFLLFRIFTLYSKSLPLDVASRVWDLFCRDGDEFLFRTALGKICLYACVLYITRKLELCEYSK
jgi:hypothetical protein